MSDIWIVAWAKLFQVISNFDIKLPTHQLKPTQTCHSSSRTTTTSLLHLDGAPQHQHRCHFHACTVNAQPLQPMPPHTCQTWTTPPLHPTNIKCQMSRMAPPALPPCHVTHTYQTWTTHPTPAPQQPWTSNVKDGTPHSSTLPCQMALDVTPHLAPPCWRLPWRWSMTSHTCHLHWRRHRWQIPMTILVSTTVINADDAAPPHCHCHHIYIENAPSLPSLTFTSCSTAIDWDVSS